ncbi:MAG: aldehyde-activating protein [Alphaproteobacteria bacterium]|nr:aldehyde-activating protein [Alphaproteobacteria bacterium]
MTVHAGACHCGAMRVAFETAKSVSDIAVRACQCGFCRAHGACNISDGEGRVTIAVDAPYVFRYRFGLRTSDFLICRTCGVYAAAVIGEGVRLRSTVNVVGLGLAAFLDLEQAPAEYGDETTQARIARRFASWTPTTFTDGALAASYFGPH